jgi:hypothetical protein
VNWFTHNFGDLGKMPAVRISEKGVVMPGEAPIPAQGKGQTPEIETLSKQVEYLRTIIAALAAVLAVAFTAGIFWDKLRSYEATVDKQQDQITQLKHQIDEHMNSLSTGITTVKTNLGLLGEPSYQIEATNEAEAGRCETGNVVTGVRFDSSAKKVWIRCSSISRAVWNPTATASTAKTVDQSEKVH